MNKHLIVAALLLAIGTAGCRTSTTARSSCCAQYQTAAIAAPCPTPCPAPVAVAPAAVVPAPVVP